MQPTTAKFRPTRILVPTDFSEAASAALETAVEFAGLVSAHIYLLNVVPMLPLVPIPEYPVPIFPEQQFLDQARSHATEKMTAAVASLKLRGVPSSFGIEIGNDVPGNIMMVIDREHIDMLVLSTHGMSGWKPMIFGSIAEKVIRTAECPVLLVHASKAAQALAAERPAA